MEFVRAGLGDIVHHRASIAAKLGIIVGNHLNLGDGVLVAEKYVGAADGVVVVALPVNLKIIGSSALTVYGKLGPVVVAEAGIARGRDPWNE